MNYARLALFALFALPAAAADLDGCVLSAGPALASVTARCARIEVPENPDAPDGAQIGLRVALISPLNIEPRPDPLVILAGGPGQAATDFFLAYAYAFERIRQDREILLIDQRGTGRSNPLNCDSTTVVLDSYADKTDVVPGVQRCLESLTGDPRYYTTSVAVRDLEHIRRALGYDTLNLYGISYGTRVAQHFMRRFPDSTRAVILDGVVPPENVLGPDIAINAQAALDSLMDRCAADSGCSARFPELERAFDELHDRLKGKTVDVEINDPDDGSRITRQFTEFDFIGAVRLSSYSPTTLAILPLLIDAAWQNERYEPLAAQALMSEKLLVDMVSVGMHNSVVCTEDAPYFHTNAVSNDQLEQTYLGHTVLDLLELTCSVWPVGVHDTDFRDPLASDIPTLLLSGEFDPVTPPAYGDRAAAGLSNSLHLVGKAQGHGIAPLGCVPRIMVEFIEAGSLEGLETACFDKLTVAPFFVDFSGPLR